MTSVYERFIGKWFSVIGNEPRLKVNNSDTKYTCL